MIYAGWFYVMRCEFHKENIYKLGYTNEIDITMRALQHTRETTSPSEFHIVMAVWTKDANGFEQNEIFKLFAPLRLRKKYPGSSKEPEFFEIEKGSFAWNALESKLDQEIRHSGIKWSESHGKYHSTDLFGPFEQTNENKKIIQEDAELVAEPIIGDRLGELLDALEINNTSSESEDSHDEEEQPIHRRGENVKYYLDRLPDGAIVTTPERYIWSTDRHLNGKVYSMKARYNARMDVLEDLDGHMTFHTLSDLCAEFVRRLGWNDAFGQVFKHSPGAAYAVEHKKSNNTICWHTMYLLDGESKTPLKRVIS
jgi:hypothetical protein